METLSRRDAITIIEALKRGTPPPPSLASYLHVGRGRWVEGMCWYLDVVRADALSAVRLIAGDYGSGKTHFLRVAEQRAYERAFVVSEVTLTKDVRLDRFETIWKKIMDNLTHEDANAPMNGIEELLNYWCEKVAESGQVSNELAKLNALRGLDPDFRQAIGGYLQQWVRNGGRRGELLPYLQWFGGDAVRPPGVRGRIDRASARAMLRSLILFLRHIGYSGLVLIFDELELILHQRVNVRDACYEVVRQFVDNADNLAGLLLIFSITEQMILDTSRGIPSYPALYQRIGGLIRSFSEYDYRSVLINLNHLPLRKEELVELARRIRQVHAVAYSWPAAERVRDSYLDRFAEHALATGEVPAPRFLVQLTVTVLDSAQQNPHLSIEELIPSKSEILKEIRSTERGRYAPWDEADVAFGAR